MNSGGASQVSIGFSNTANTTNNSSNLVQMTSAQGNYMKMNENMYVYEPKGNQTKQRPPSGRARV